MNYADKEIPYTRTHEFKHYHPERKCSGKSIIYKEFSRFALPGDEPYYPVDTKENRALFSLYQEKAKREASNVIFGGRLGAYRYYDMDDTIAAALLCLKEKILPRLGLGAV
jgi:UDP-galactopyranose mutase